MLRQLEDIEELSRQAIKGELSQIVRLQTILAETFPRRSLKCHDVRQQSHELSRLLSGAEKVIVRPQSPVAVAIAGILLDRLGDDASQVWSERAAGYYLGRALALNRALVAADLVLARQLTLTQFASIVQASNPIEVHHAPHAAYQPRDLNIESTDGGTLAALLGRSFSVVLETATQHAALPVPALLPRLAEAISSMPLTPLDRDLPLTALARSWSDIVRNWTGRPSGAGDSSCRRPRAG